MLVFNKLAKLVEELAKHKFRHHDLTTENVLVRKDGSIKMIDYGGSWIDYEEASFSSCMDMKRWVNDIFLPFRYPLPYIDHFLLHHAPPGDTGLLHGPRLHPTCPSCLP